jgi:UDP-perosamine 4-acetyltransferase
MLRLLGADVLGYTDPEDRGPVLGLPHLGDDEVLADYGTDEVAVALGAGSTGSTDFRRRLYAQTVEAGYRFPPILHPRAVIAPEATVGRGVQVAAGAVVQPGATLGDNVLVNTRASVDHDCRIGAHAHVAPGATLSGDVVLGEGVHVGTGASVIQGVTVGAGSIVGAGAVVLRDVPPGTTVVGVPAHPRSS